MGNHGRGRPAPSSPWAWANHASLSSAGVGGGQRRHVLVAVAPLRRRPRPPRPHAHRPIRPPMVVLARPATCCCRPPGAPRPRGRLPAWLAPPPRRWPPQEAAPWRSPSVAAARRAWRPALRCASTAGGRGSVLRMRLRGDAGRTGVRVSGWCGWTAGLPVAQCVLHELAVAAVGRAQVAQTQHELRQRALRKPLPRGLLHGGARGHAARRCRTQHL